MAPSLLSCPEGVIDHIVKLLPNVKAARETCKRLNRIASPYLFPVLYISYWPGCDEPKEHWELFDSILKDHYENRLARADYHALKQALPHLKRPRSPVLTNRTANDGIDHDFREGAQSLESSSPIFKFWRRFEPKSNYPVSFAPRCDWVPTSKGLVDKTPIYGMDWLDDRLTDDITPCGVPNTLAGSPASKELGGQDFTDWESFLYEHAERLERASTHKLFILAREARVLQLALLVLEDKRMQSQITKFRVDASCDMPTLYCPPGLAITLFNKESPFHTRLAKGVSATNIKKFNLTLGTGLPLDVGVGKRLRTIFESMPQLEELFFEPHDIHHFPAIPTEKTFPRLRKITFNCGLMRLEQLFKLL
ncbi:hypothetical protein FCOIX_5443 [Fusarium coicis]|nr:hypothetical protein FCOIX_5443 [Fusarium coicis]